MRIVFTCSLLGLGLALAACGRQDAGSRESGSPTTAARHDVPQASAPASPAARPAEAAPAPTLSGNGLGPGLAFGVKQAQAVAAAAKAFGAPTGKEHNGECGEAPRDFVSFHDLQLAFQDGRFVGWSLGGATPKLRSAGGLAIGAPRAVLGGAQVDEEGSLGPEFEVDGVGGILDAKGARVEALWAGAVCQFR